MIRRPTVFVIGAGASKAYGLPLGWELKHLLVRQGPDGDLCRLASSSGFEGWQVQGVLDDLKQDPGASIDDYLYRRQSIEFIVQIGRALIAAAMGVAMVKKPSADRADDWLGYVLENMREGATTFQEFIRGNRGVRFVTFNFDSVIESRLIDEVKRAYRVEGKEAELSSLVVHVHGRLPQPPSVKMTVDDPIHSIHYKWTQWLKPAAESVNVVFDAIDKKFLADVQAIIGGAEVVCFLGFRYHLDNVRKLGLPSSLKTMSVFGSAYDLMHGRQEQAKDRVSRYLELGNHDQNSLQVLHRFHIFRD